MRHLRIWEKSLFYRSRYSEDLVPKILSWRSDVFCQKRLKENDKKNNNERTNLD